MGRIWLCIHERPVILHLEPGQKHDQQGKRDQPKEDPVKHQYDLRIPRSHPILHKNKIPRDHQQYALICRRHDRTIKHDRHRNADRWSKPKRYLYKQESLSGNSTKTNHSTIDCISSHQSLRNERVASTRR